MPELPQVELPPGDMLLSERNEVKMEQPCFKVVKVLRRRLVSAAVPARASNCATYPIGEWVEPPIPGSKLYAFGKLEDAEAWRKLRASKVGQGRLATYVAVAEDAAEAVTIARFPSGPWVDRFWNGEILEGEVRRSIIVVPPRGSIQCSRLKLMAKP